MDLTVIIPNFNTRELTLKCIDSIIKYNENGLSYEIIVVDNGSFDKSAEFIQKKYPKVKVLKNEVNLGFAKACNKGIKLSRGRYVLLLNSDTAVMEGSLERLVDFAEKTKDAGVVGSQLINSDGSIQASVVRLPTLLGAIKKYWFGKKGSFGFYVPRGSEAVRVEAVVGASFLITPEALKRVGYLDERYFMYYEDLDYCRRVAKANLAVYYLPGSKVVHYHGKSGENAAKPARQWKRLIPSSKIYHGIFKHTLILSVIWIGQKFQSLAKRK
jgi:hypothetical protein